MKNIQKTVCVCIEEDYVFLMYICCLEWLNELVHLVVNGSYDRLFIENSNLRDLINKNQDDPQLIEIMNKLNNDQELVNN